MKILFGSFILCFALSCNNSTPGKESEQEKTDWKLLPFTKADDVNPILTPIATTEFDCPVSKRNLKWEEKDVFNPAAIVRHDTVFLLYRAEDKIGKFAGTSRLGLAWSTDGLHFTRLPKPVLYPDNDSARKYEWEGGCEDPRIVESDQGTYLLTYTGYDGDKARLLIASSNDLYHWNKHGLAFARAMNGKYVNGWSKSGSIVCKNENGKMIASKINGKYWMYWGDTDIFLASSDDLINWMPAENDNGSLKVIFGKREGRFDSDLVEPGPPAILQDSGILLLYNSRNTRSKGDTSLGEGTYAASQILMNKNDPSEVINRMNEHFITPDRPYEMNGQVNNVCFVEGLVNYKGKWFLYYGTADSKIAVAVRR